MKRTISIILCVIVALFCFTGCENEQKKLQAEYDKAVANIEETQSQIDSLQKTLDEQQALYNDLTNQGTFDKTNDAKQTQIESDKVTKEAQDKISDLKNQLSNYKELKKIIEEKLKK